MDSTLVLFAGTRGYTLDEAKALFALVENPEHWKAPIRATVPAGSDLAGIKGAVEFYTATVPTFTGLPSGGTLVEAAGYWAGPAN